MKIREWALRFALGAIIAATIIVGLVDAVEHSNSSLEQLNTENGRIMKTAIEATTNSKYLGMWITADRHIRHELLPNGRYDEARGKRQSAYEGRYEITGNLIAYWDDTGFTADGVFVDIDTLHHGGMVFHRLK